MDASPPLRTAAKRRELVICITVVVVLGGLLWPAVQMYQQHAARRQARAQLVSLFQGPSMQLKEIFWEGQQMIVELRASGPSRRDVERAATAAYEAIFQHDAAVPDARVRIYDAATDAPLFGTILHRDDWKASGTTDWWVVVPFRD